MDQVVEKDVCRTGDVVPGHEGVLAGDQVRLLVGSIVLLLSVEIHFRRLSVQVRYPAEALYQDLVDDGQLDGGVAVEGEIPDRDRDGRNSTEGGQQ